MNIYPMTYICEKDFDLFHRQVKSIEQLARPEFQPHTVYKADDWEPTAEQWNVMTQRDMTFRVQPPTFYPWPKWVHCLAELDCLDDMVNYHPMEANDYVLLLDSDIIFKNGDVIDEVLGVCDYAGIPTDTPTFSFVLGRDWRYFSGSFRWFRVGALCDMLSEIMPNVRIIRTEVSAMQMKWMNDIVTSYCMNKVTDSLKNLKFDDCGVLHKK